MAQKNLDLEKTFEGVKPLQVTMHDVTPISKRSHNKILELRIAGDLFLRNTEYYDTYDKFSHFSHSDFEGFEGLEGLSHKFLNEIWEYLIELRETSGFRKRLCLQPYCGDRTFVQLKHDAVYPTVVEKLKHGLFLLGVTMSGIGKPDIRAQFT